MNVHKQKKWEKQMASSNDVEQKHHGMQKKIAIFERKTSEPNGSPLLISKLY